MMPTPIDFLKNDDIIAGETIPSIKKYYYEKTSPQ